MILTTLRKEKKQDYQVVMERTFWYMWLISGQGVIQAANEKGKYAFGVVADQNNLAPNTVLTSFVLDIEKAFDQLLKWFKEAILQEKYSNPSTRSVI
jgi:ABC transporter substrate-binding protein PnrA-like